MSGPLVLPRHAHVPGAGAEPDRAPLEAAKARVARPVTDAGWEQNEPYRYGAALCLAGYFWEAHEVWEAVWLACPPNARERRLLRALIQLANAGLKLKMGRVQAARRLLGEAEALLGECGAGRLMGVDTAALRSATTAAGRAAADGEAVWIETLLQPLRPLESPGLQRDMHYIAG